ncbi:uncharacterized protein UMAG_01125 [Mycosarcoma maydis]|uniref:Uncharacterized protein n=1 Tax=Mycosarcoma maydis TaxID=5270 RepID=A0A0D1EA03_MYCMD|nr:uncharacterized protein UMAG_01125 [Ustilago maydis 521]KIS71220.1 hypothetical protein UMAG_01125 [Ustilago maydis 521]|eukprot:XP_011387077.1 hypothetical protein UMAG_01125 [Ustilago maydis 521]
MYENVAARSALTTRGLKLELSYAHVADEQSGITNLAESDRRCCFFHAIAEPAASHELHGKTFSRSVSAAKHRWNCGCQHFQDTALSRLFHFQSDNVTKKEGLVALRRQCRAENRRWERKRNQEERPYQSVSQHSFPLHTLVGCRDDLANALKQEAGLLTSARNATLAYSPTPLMLISEK